MVGSVEEALELLGKCMLLGWWGRKQQGARSWRVESSGKAASSRGTSSGIDPELISLARRDPFAETFPSVWENRFGVAQGCCWIRAAVQGGWT